jgi:hypothetical protein
MVILFTVFLLMCVLADDWLISRPLAQLSSTPRAKVKVNVTLRLVVYRKSFLLGVKPLETHDQNYFLQLNHCIYSPYVTTTLDLKMGLSLMNMLGLSSSVRIAHIACY